MMSWFYGIELLNMCDCMRSEVKFKPEIRLDLWLHAQMEQRIVTIGDADQHIFDSNAARNYNILFWSI